MSKEVRTYSDLLDAIGRDLKPRLKKSLHLTDSFAKPVIGLNVDEALDEALHSGPTLELIAEFVGYRHVELKAEEQGR